MDITTFSTFSTIPIRLDIGSVIRLVPSYKVNSSFSRRRVQLKTDWEILYFSDTITFAEFASALTTVLFKRIFASVQSSTVSYVNLTASIPFSGDWRSFRIPLTNVVGQQTDDAGSGKLLIELLIDQRPRNRYTLNLTGVPNDILAKRSRQAGPSELDLLEKSLSSPIRLPIARIPLRSSDEVLGFVAVTDRTLFPRYTSLSDFTNPSYRKAQFSLYDIYTGPVDAPTTSVPFSLFRHVATLFSENGIQRNQEKFVSDFFYRNSSKRKGG